MQLQMGVQARALTHFGLDQMQQASPYPTREVSKDWLAPDRGSLSEALKQRYQKG